MDSVVYMEISINKLTGSEYVLVQRVALYIRCHNKVPIIMKKVIRYIRCHDKVPIIMKH